MLFHVTATHLINWKLFVCLLDLRFRYRCLSTFQRFGSVQFRFGKPNFNWLVRFGSGQTLKHWFGRSLVPWHTRHTQGRGPCHKLFIIRSVHNRLCEPQTLVNHILDILRIFLFFRFSQRRISYLYITWFDVCLGTREITRLNITMQPLISYHKDRQKNLTKNMTKMFENKWQDSQEHAALQNSFHFFLKFWESEKIPPARILPWTFKWADKWEEKVPRPRE